MTWRSIQLSLTLLLLLLCPQWTLSDDSVSVSIDISSNISLPIKPNLVSFSIEVYDFVRWTNWYPAPTRPAWVTLMQQLKLTPGQEGPRYRIGGDSTDLTVYDMNPLPKVPVDPIIHSLNSTELLSWKQALENINSKAVLGLNFRQTDNASWAVSYVQAIDKYLGWDLIIGMEIGNEVDLYSSNGIRDKNYSYPQYKQEWLLYTSTIAKEVPSVPTKIFQGLVNIGFDWLGNDLNDYLAAAGPTLFSISQHSYPVPSCNGENVTINDIVNDQYAISPGDFLTNHNTVQILTKAGIEFVIGEGGVAVCNGNGPMVLNTFATALWVIHELFEISLAGVPHWYFHSWGTDTDTFSVLVYGNTKAPDTFLVQPIYYGLRLFAMATSHYGTMIQSNVKSTNRNIHVFSTINSLQILSVVIVHKDTNTKTNATVTIIIPITGTVPSGDLIRLIGPSAASEYGITLAGQTYDKSNDGKPIGDYKSEFVQGHSIQGGVSYEFTVTPVSSVLLTVKLSQQVDIATVTTYI